MDEPTKIKAENFARIVRRYCDWAESSGEIDTDLQTAQKILAELFLNVLDLPDDEFGDDAKLDDVSVEQLEIVRERFSKLPIDGHWTVFDPINDEENDSVYGLLSDDLSDIYRDIKYGLLLFDAKHFSEAVWEWKFNFKIHWGRHLLDAQIVIYSYFN